MSMPKPSVMGYKMFVLKTTTGTGAVVRKSLAGIDSMLKYWDQHHTQNNHGQNATMLQNVLAACAGWKAQKAAKIAQGSRNTLKRARAVDQLADQVMLRLKWELFHNMKTGNYQNFQRPAGRGLQHGHQNERQLYANIKQRGGRKFSTNFGGGSLVEANMTAVANHGLDNMGYQNVPPMVQQIFAQNKAFNQLNLAEFEALGKFFEQNNMSMQNPVHYVRKTERINDYMLVVVNGRLRKQAHANYSTPNNGNDLDMWAMDRYGNFMSKPANTIVQHGTAMIQINHSSLNAGNDVICAGTVKIADGVITFLANDSGHYLPTKQDLHNALICLVDELGATFDVNAVVECHTPPRERYNNWQTLYNNVGAAGTPF